MASGAQRSRTNLRAIACQGYAAQRCSAIKEGDTACGRLARVIHLRLECDILLEGRWVEARVQSYSRTCLIHRLCNSRTVTPEVAVTTIYGLDIVTSGR